MLSEIQALGHADAHVAPDEIPDDTSTETEAGLESNEEEEERDVKERRVGGGSGGVWECGQRGRGIPDMDAVVGRGRGKDGEGEGKRLCKGSRYVTLCCKYACKETSIFVPLPHMKHKQAGEQGASLGGLTEELQKRYPKICI